MSCEEAQLHKERLQALAEKRKRQTEIEDKRNQLDDLVLQLQHVKSKAMRERWLLQGTGVEEEEARRKQLEQDEEQGRRLEDIIQRLESEIGALESEESQISAKEQVLRERLKETERSIEDLQKSLMTQDGDATSCVLDRGHPSPEQLVRTGPLASGEHASSRPAMFAMEINIQRDPLTGEQRILSANRVSPLEAATRGVKVYDDGKKVVYEVTSSGVVSTSTMENGWSSSQVEQLIQQAARPVVQRGDSMRGHVTVTPARAKVSPHDDDLSPPSCAPPSVPSSPPAQVTLQREPQLGMMPPTSAPITTQPGAHPGQEQSGQPSSDHPVTMVFLGYQEVEDTSDSRRLLGFDGAVKAEVVLIDEDDEKSLREKTVTDISAIDGTAADLVSGRPTTSEAASTELSSEGREPDSASSPNANQDASAPPPGLTPPTGYSPSPGVTVTTANGCGPPNATRHPYTVMKSWLADDVTEPIPRERVLKSVSFQESVSFITDSSAIMELESQPTHDTEMVKEICYLDHVLDAASEIPTNGDTSEHHINTYPDDISSSVSVSAASAVSLQSEGHMYATFTDEEHSAIHTNGHAQDDYTHSKPKFELRAFHEEKKPAKLFSPGDEQPVRVTRRRPTEEVQELERERQELIKDQAVKKNPGIAQRWWNPPQEIPLEEQLEAEQLESLRKYQERKQQKQNPSYTYTQPQVSGPSTVVSFDPHLKRQDDIVEEQIDFSLARKQFLLDNKKDVTPQIYSAKPFSKSRASLGSCDIITESGESHMTCSDEGIGGDFTCAQAVMTILHEDDEPKAHFQSSFHPEESDSGLDELSVRSQDTTIFSLDNVSDSGASLPPTPQPLTPVSPPTPQPTTPINGQSGSSLTEDDLEYHAGVLVENAIQNALAAQTGNGWQTSFSDSSAPASPPATKQPLSSSPLPVSSSNSVQSSVCSSPDVKVQEKPLEKLQTPSPPPSQPVSPPPARPKDGGPRIKIQSSYARALAASAPAVGHATSLEPQVSRPTPVYRPPSPPSPDKPEFSYFSKYSEAAELRSTAAPSKGPEVEPASGPFRLRSKKQRTLSMIEEEIRAAQQREEELKKQRENQPTMVVRPSNVNGNGPMRTGVRKTTIPPADKMKSNSQPTRLTLTAKTAPGKIEKVRPAPPVSPSPSEGALSDAGSEDSSGSSRPKNFMQTLMEDYETHKVKRKEKMEDSQVLEATRVTRRKSDMALRWEAGIYTNEDGPEEEEEEEEEE